MDAVLDSTAAIFLGESDDLLIKLLIQGKLRKLNAGSEVEIEVLGQAITCPSNFLHIGFLDQVRMLSENAEKTHSSIISQSSEMIKVGSQVSNKLLEKAVDDLREVTDAVTNATK